MRKPILIGLGVLALLAGLWFGWRWWTEGRYFESTDNAIIQSDITVIAPKVAGYVATLPVAENQAVAKGDVLMTIDDSDFRAAVAAAEANLAAQDAAVVQAEAAITQQRAALHQLEAMVESAKAELDRAAADLSRYEQLKKTQAASAQRYEQALSDERKAEAALSETEANLESGQAQLGVLEAARQQTLAEVQSADAQLQQAKLDLAITVIHAPVDGVVGNRGAEVGAYLRAGAQAMVVVPLAQVYVVANFKETQIEEIRPGQEVRVTVDAYPDLELKGTVESFAPASGALFSLLPPENATGNFTKIVQRLPIRIGLAIPPELARQLMPGLSVEVAVDTRTGDHSRQLAEVSLFKQAQAAEQP
jgi:membrane fusion protein (multidrug efflux system)